MTLRQIVLSLSSHCITRGEDTCADAHQHENRRLRNRFGPSIVELPIGAVVACIDPTSELWDRL